MKKKVALFLAMIFALSMLLIGCSGLSEEYKCLIGTWSAVGGGNNSTYTATISENDGKVYLEVSIRDYTGNAEFDEQLSGKMEITYTDSVLDKDNPIQYKYRVGNSGLALTYHINIQQLRIKTQQSGLLIFTKRS